MPTEAIAPPPAPTPPPPAQTPAPAAPVPATPSPTTKSWTDALDALPDIDDPTPAKPAAAPEKPADKPQDAVPDKKADKAEDKTADKPAEKQASGPAFRTNKEFRDWGNARDAAAKAAESKLVELENEVKELRAVVPKTQEGAEAIAQRLAETEQKLARHEQTIEMQAFEHSEKYQKEYAEPYYGAREKAYKDVAEMMVSEPTGEMDSEDKPIMKKRAATKADFDKIYSLPRAQAREMAKQMFGEDDAIEVMSHRKNISEMAEKAQTALADRRQNYSKHKQEEQATQSQKQIAIQKLWKTANETISKDPKRAMYWGEDKDDPKANEALAKGFQLADEFFSEKRDQMKEEERVEFDAHIRHTIAMGPKLAYKVNRLTSELKAAQEEIAQLRGSAPGAPKPISDEAVPKKLDSTEAAIDNM